MPSKMVWPKAPLPADGHYTSPCDIYTLENMAIAMSYFSVGFVMSFVSTPLNIYMVEVLDAEPEMQNTIGILQTLPWSLKLIFGFLSDAVPIFGMHRKPYLTMGALVYSGSFVIYGLLEVETVGTLALCIFFATLGLIQMDVMADTMCVERSKFEPDDGKGQMQASYYSIRFGGGLIGAIAGAAVCNQSVWGWGLNFRQVALLNGLIPFIFVLPWLYNLKEKYKAVHHYHILHHVHNKEEATESKEASKPVDVSLQMVELGKAGQKKKSVPVHKFPERPQILRSESIKLPANNSKPVKVVPRYDPSKLGSISEDSRGRSSSSSAPIVIATETTSLLPSATQGKKAPSSSLYSATAASGAPTSDSIGSSSMPMGGESMNSITDSQDSDSLVDEIEAIGLKLEEPDPTQGIRKQIHEIWETVQLQAVWRPMAFVYIFNMLQIPNVAWQSYLQLSLEFPAWVLGLTVILGSFMTFAGTMAYKLFFFRTSWRLIYVWTVGLTTFFSLLQLCLIFQVNHYFHLSNYLFSMGDDVISAYISGIQFLPVCIMYMRLCPEGAEGASYSMLTTFGNIALVCSSNLGNLFAGIWDVSNDAMKRHDISGLWKLSLLTSCLAVVPLSLLSLLPHSAEEQDELSKSKVRSKTGGIVFLSVLVLSLVWTISTALYRINSP